MESIQFALRNYILSKEKTTQKIKIQNVYFDLQSMASDTSQMQCQRRLPSTSGLFTWIRIFRFADSLMRQGC